ncbi:proteasome regulatory particle base subunit, variant 2 [Schistosoma haematobium]|uniref:Proteasome regulatory particle base subunit, variant 2 n=1 Tax=Schistosoma haematobium TaxID=6185 RepID=A0A922IIJ9_SCHHA|nr:proteasome regulatory particle base subunit, variant 2 [Schistosoma haematobium]KAH9579458.1 proteasome regulatory particle base subunit, variant 2 [Schistosoma haematobium]
MQVGTATSVLNPTSEYLNSQGTWVTYILVILVVHFILLCVPLFTTAVVWTLTCTFHNVVCSYHFQCYSNLVVSYKYIYFISLYSQVMYRLLHWEKGSPYETLDQGESRVLTQWEQFDDGEQFSPTKKFLLVVPIVLFPSFQSVGTCPSSQILLKRMWSIFTVTAMSAPSASSGMLSGPAASPLLICLMIMLISSVVGGPTSIGRFLLASFYTEYDPLHCFINASSMIVLAVLPKLPQFYRVRFFGINRW